MERTRDVERQLTPVEIAGIEQLMRPGEISTEGFLGKDEELPKVIDEDAKILERLSVTHEQIATRLEGLIAVVDAIERGEDVNGWEKETNEDCYEDTWSMEAAKKGDLKVVRFGVWGGEFCPFCQFHGEEEKFFGNDDYLVVNVKTGEKLEFAGLLPHLIGKHHFFEGKGTSYRVDPEKAVRILIF